MESALEYHCEALVKKELAFEGALLEVECIAFSTPAISVSLLPWQKRGVSVNILPLAR